MGCIGKLWSEEDDAILRRDWGKPGLKPADIAQRVNRSPRAVRTRAGRLGLTSPSWNHARWSPKDDAYLEAHIETHSAKFIATHLHRTVDAVKRRAAMLGVSAKYHDGWYNAAEVAEIFGVRRQWVLDKITSGALRARAHIGRRSDGQQKEWHIDEKEVRKFIRARPWELHGRDVDMMQIVDILVGVDVVHNGESLEEVAD